jgi:uncharacterized protein DUF5666
MNVGNRSLWVVSLLVVGCGSGIVAPQLTRATLEGKLVNSPQALRVEVPGTGASTTSDASGSFLLTQVPEGAAFLRFSGSGIEATLAIQQVVRGEYRRLRVTVSGTQAREHCERTETEFQGQVTAIDVQTLTLTVAGRSVTATDATVIREKGAKVGFEAISVGSTVEVQGALQADGSVLARRISIEHEGNGGDHAIALVGKLNAIDGTTLDVSGLVVTLSPDTEILRGATKLDASALKVGDRLLVRGQVQDDRSIAASRIRVLGAGRDEEEEDEEFHVTGEITAISLEDQTFRIGETLIVVGDHTEFEGDFGEHGSLADLEVGDKVDAEVVKQADGSLLAREVRRFRSPPPPSPAVVATGPIEALAADAITVAGTQFAVTPGILVRRGEEVVPFSDLKLGEPALVKGAPTDKGTLLAQFILVAPGPRPGP